MSNEQYHNPRTGLRTYILSFPDGGARLEVMRRPDTVDADPSKLNIGFVHVSFAVGSSDAVDSKTAELADAGYNVASGPEQPETAIMRVALSGRRAYRLK